MKRYLALLLSVVMILSLGITDDTVTRMRKAAYAVGNGLSVKEALSSF